MELYVHIPFCRKKCKYCDFISYPGRSEEDIKIYVAPQVLHLESLHGRAEPRWTWAREPYAMYVIGRAHV